MQTLRARNIRSPRGLVRTMTFGALTLGVSVIPLTHAFALDDNALPSGGTVVGGSATIDYSGGNKLDVYQHSDRAVIDWDSFNIGKNSTTQFYQPGKGSIIVNRVTGAHEDPTQILGAMKANGTVFVLDRNGVIFGADSKVDVGSIVVSTGTIDDNAFMSGSNVLTLDNINSGASIVNNGKITVAEAGLAAFVAPTVVNNGLIQANTGRVVLASGTKATVDLYGDNLVELATDLPLDHASIKNTGTINAQGGTVLITASAAKSIVDSVINMSGIINVSSATLKGGKIVLEGANTEVSGTLDASGKTGGGTILIGGEYQGGGTTRHADKVNITKTASIKANATGATGDGGDITVWSDDETDVAGSFEATGGLLSGKGGFIETSSKKLVNIGSDASFALGGKSGGGTWLIDPEDIVISDSGDDGNAATSDIASSTINSTLNGGGNVTITTNGALSGSGDISLSGATINKSTANNAATLTLQAYRNITMTGSSINSTSNDLLNVVFNADYNADNDGAIRIINSSIATKGGYFVAGGGSGALGGTDGIFGNGDGTGADDVAAQRIGLAGVTVSGSTISTGAGSMYITGKGGATATTNMQGVAIISSSTLSATTGSINIKGTGGGTTSASSMQQYGVYLGGASLVQTSDGNIKITGTGGLGGSISSTNNYGFYMNTGADISITNNGALTVMGSGVSGDNGDGIRLDDAGTTIYTKNGDLNMTGTSSALATGTALDGILIYSNASIGTTGTGNVNLTGTVTSAGTAHYGTRLFTSGSATATGGGSINITGTSNGGTDFDIDGSSIATSGGAGTGAITVSSNNFTLLNSTINAAGTLTIKPRTASTSIGLGGGTGTLNLDDIELAALSASKLIIGDSAVGTGDIVVDSWNLAGKTFSTELYGNDINFNDTNATAGVDYTVKLGTGDFTAYAKDNGTDYGTVTVSGAAGGFTKAVAGTSTLSLLADRDIVISSNSDIASTTGVLNVVLNSDRNANQDGPINLLSGIATNGGYLVMGGGSGTLGGTDGILGNGDGTGADDVAAYGTLNSGIGITGSHISTGAGKIYITGHGSDTGAAASWKGINITNAAVIESTSGDISIKGTGGNGTDSNYGLYIGGTGTKISSNSGKITVYGKAQGNGLYNTGIYMQNGGAIESTGTSIIDITAIQGAGTGQVDFLTAGTPTINIGGSSAAGNITINANTVQLGASDIRTTGTITVKPTTASTSIGLGGGSGTLNLDDTELSYFTAGTLIIGDSVAGTGDIDLDSWNLSGKTFNVELYGNDIDVGGLTLGTGDFKAYAMDNAAVDLGTLTVSAAITKSLAGNSTLNLMADKDITINASSAITATTGSLNVVMNSDRNADQNGAIAINSNITTNGGYATFGGGVNPLTDNAVAFGTGSGFLLTSSTISTNGGDINIHGKANGAGTSHGVSLSSATLNSGAGALNVYGSTTGDTTNPKGINLYGTTGAAFNILSSSGNITLDANSASAGGNQGLYLWQNGSISSTSGNITITSASNSTDLDANGATPTISIGSGTGNVTLNVNTVNLTSFSSISAGNILTIKPRTASTSIGLGGGSGTLNLDDTELSKLSALKLIIGDSAAGTGDIDLDSWDLSAKTFNTQIYGNDIDVGGLTLGTGDFTAYAMDNGSADLGSLTVSAAISKSLGGASTLNLWADNDIAITSSIISTNGALNIVANVDRDNDNAGIINSTAALNSKGGYIVFGGGAGDLGGADGILGNGDGTGADDVGAKGYSGTAAVRITGAVDAGGGDIYVHGNGWQNAGCSNNCYGTTIGSSITTSGSGSINIYGNGGGTAGNSYLHGMQLANATLQTENGDINLTGSVIGTPVNSTGISLSGSTIKTIGTGSINLRTTTGSFEAYGTASTITSGKNITLVTDRFATATSFTLNAADTIYLLPYTASTSVGLGGGGGTLQFSDTLLAGFVAQNLVVGSSLSTGDIDLDSWDLSGKSFNVALFGNDIDVGGVTLGTGNFTANAMDNAAVDLGTLTVSAPITKSVAGTSALTLNADKDIVFNAGSNITASGTSVLNTVLNADRDADQDGAISITTSAITTNGGYAVLGGGSGTLWGADGIKGTADDATSTGADNVAAWGNSSYSSGVSLANGDISTGTGDFFINGHGYNDSTSGGLAGVNIGSGSILQTTSGSLNIIGRGGNGVASNYGISFAGSGGVVTGLQTDTGAITINGYGGNGTGTDNNGITIGRDIHIVSNGDNAADVRVTGTGGSSGSGTGTGFDFLGGSGASNITSKTGDIYITGYGANTGNGIIIDKNLATVVSTGTTADAANIIVNGTSGASGGNGFSIDGNLGGASYLETNAGNIDLTGTTIAGGGVGVYLARGGTYGTVRSTGSGNIKITGTNTTGAAGGISGGSATSIVGTATMTGTITLLADYVDMALLQLVTDTSGKVVIKPYTASSSIGLGGGSGTLNLTDAELANITTGTLVIGDSATGTGDINLDSWDLSGKTFNVELYGNDITFLDGSSAGYGVKLGTGNFTAVGKTNGSDYADIAISATSITKAAAGTSTLLLKTDGKISATSGSSIVSTGGKLNTILWTNADGSAKGGVDLSGTTINTNNGEFFAGGGLDDGSDLVDGFGNIAYDGIMGDGRPDYASTSGSHAINIYSTSSITTGTGDLTLLGKGNGIGVRLFGGTLSTTDGNIRIVGQSVSTTGNTSWGVSSEATSPITASGTGSIYISGIGGNTGNIKNYGIFSDVITANTGNITLVGKAGTGTSDNVGVYSRTSIYSGSGAVMIKGLAGDAVTAGIKLQASNTIGGNAASGEIQLIADTVEIGGTVKTSGTILLKPLTSSTSIGLGGGAGTLNLDDTELANLTAGTLIIGDALAGTGDIAAKNWNFATKNFNVELYGNDINLNNLTLGSGDFLAYAADNAAIDLGTLTIAGPIAKSAAGTSLLDLRADKDIVFNGAANITASGSGILNVVLNADRDADHDGAISMTASTITTNGGYAVLGGGAGDLGGTDGILGNGDGTGADDVAAWGNDSYVAGVNLANGGINTGTGNMYLTGHGAALTSTLNAGVNLNTTTLQTSGGGTITINGIGGGTGTLSSGNTGINQNGGSLTTASGKITLNGQAGTGSSGSGSYGIIASNISSTGGDISLTGTGGTSGDYNHGIRSSTGTINSGSGKITITGIAGVNGADLALTGGTIGGTGQTGDIQLNIDNSGSVGATYKTSGNIIIKPRTASRNIYIGTSGTGLSLSSAQMGYYNAGTLVIGDSAAGTGDIAVAAADISGKTYDVELYGNDIDLGTLTLGSGDFTAYAKDNAAIDLGTITVSAPITKSVAGTSSLVLNADKDIVFNSGGNITASGTGVLNTVLNADRDADHDGAISITSSAITTNGGYAVLGGGSGTLGGTDGILGNGDGTGADDVAAWGNSAYYNGVYTTGSTITAGAGNIYVSGQGYNDVTTSNHSGVYVAGSSLTTTSGDININGTAGLAATNMVGFFLQGGSTKVQTGSGNINIKAASATTATTSTSAVNIDAAKIISTGTGTGLGSINIDATNYQTTNNGYALIMSYSSAISSKDADINITTHAGTATSASTVAGAYSTPVIEATGAGNIKIETKSGGSSDAINFFNDNGSQRIGSATMTGNITLITDGIDTLEGSDSIISLGDVVIKPETNTTSIGLGGGAGTLNLDDTSLARISAGRLIIGDSASGKGDIDVDSWDMSGKTYDVELYGNDIDLGGVTLGSGDFTAYAKNAGADNADLVVSGVISKAVAGDSTLTLLSDRNILLGGGDNIASTTGSLNVDLTADYNNDLDGKLTIGGATLNTNGGDIALTSVPGILLNGTFGMDSKGGDIVLTGPVTTASSQTWNAGTGEIKTTGKIAAGTNDLTLIADKLDLGDTVTNTGVLTLKPYTNNTSVGLGGGSGNFNLSDTELGYISTGRLVIGSTASTGDVNIATWDLSSKTHDVQVFGSDMDVGGLTLGSGDVTLYAKGGGIQVSANSISNSSGDLNLLTAYDILVSRTLKNTGTGKINLFAGWDASSAITTPALFDIDDVNLGLTARGITIGTNGSISSAGTGTAVLLAMNGDFTNSASAGANAISAASGRYLVYADNPADTSKGGLTAKNLYNMGYNANAASSISGTASRFVFKYQPTLTLTANNITTSDPSTATYTYSYGGLVSGDSIGDILSGTPSYSLSGSGSTRSIVIGAGSLSSPTGYAIALTNGVMTITGGAPPPPPPAPPAPPVSTPVQDPTITYTAQIGSIVQANENVVDAGGAVKGKPGGHRGSACLIFDQSASCVW